MMILRTLDEVDGETARRGRTRGLGGICIPTMGALHEGHASLVRRAAALGPAIVWIFVNPTQFNDPADFDRYPRTLEADAELCRAAGASAVFVPSVAEVYPPGRAVEVPPLPRIATEPGLEDRHRPGHFAGVCQVVLRILRMLGPDAAIFGEKDWQQLQVVRAMLAGVWPDLRVIGAPTIREPDGLAMSSRNTLLAPAARASAPAIPRALLEAGRRGSPTEAENAMRRVLSEAGLEVEYAVVRHGEDLLAPRGQGDRALIAAWCGGVRLIDNAPWPMGP